MTRLTAHHSYALWTAVGSTRLKAPTGDHLAMARFHGWTQQVLSFANSTAWGRRMKTLATGLLALLSVVVAQSSIAQQGTNAPPDAIFYNGKIITVDSGFTIQQAFAVRDEQYVAVGTNAAIRALASEKTRLVDLRGSAVIPGLSDNHDHLYNSAKVMRGIDLVGTTSTAEVLRRLRDGLAKAKAWKLFSEASGGGHPLPGMISIKSRPMSPSWRCAVAGGRP